MYLLEEDKIKRRFKNYNTGEGVSVYYGLLSETFYPQYKQDFIKFLSYLGENYKDYSKLCDYGSELKEISEFLIDGTSSSKKTKFKTLDALKKQYDEKVALVLTAKKNKIQEDYEKEKKKLENEKTQYTNNLEKDIGAFAEHANQAYDKSQASTFFKRQVDDQGNVIWVPGVGVAKNTSHKKVKRTSHTQLVQKKTTFESKPTNEVVGTVEQQDPKALHSDNKRSFYQNHKVAIWLIPIISLVLTAVVVGLCFAPAVLPIIVKGLSVLGIHFSETLVGVALAKAVAVVAGAITFVASAIVGFLSSLTTNLLTTRPKSISSQEENIHSSPSVNPNGSLRAMQQNLSECAPVSEKEENVKSEPLLRPAKESISGLSDKPLPLDLNYLDQSIPQS